MFYRSIPSLLLAITFTESGFAAARNLTVGLLTLPKTSDPRLTGSDPNSQYFEGLRFLPLVEYHSNGELMHTLVKEFEVVNPSTYRLTIRSDITFAFGRHLDIDDVYENIEFYRFGKKGQPPSSRSSNLSEIKSVEKLSKDKILITLNAPNVGFPAELTFGILPKEALATAPENNLLGKGFETGAFVLEKASEGEWILAANRKVTAVTRPNIDRLTLRKYGTSFNCYAALHKGEVDVVQNALAPDQVKTIKAKGLQGFKLQQSPALSTMYLSFNFRKKIFASKKVRHAVANAINREEIVKYLLSEQGVLASGLFPPGHTYHATLNATPFSLEKARPLLREEGYVSSIPFESANRGVQTGNRLKFSISVANEQERLSVAQTIAQQLREVGIDASVDVLESSIFRERLNKGDLAAWIAPWTGFKTPDILRFIFHSQMIPPKGANRHQFSNAYLDSLLDNAKVESQVKRRIDLYQKAQSFIAEEFPYIFLWHRFNHVVFRDNLSGITLEGDGNYQWLTKVQ